MSENIEIQDKKLVTMSNEIVRARWSPLSVSEMRILWVVMGQMPPVSKDDLDSYLQVIDPKKPYYITKDDFVRLGCDPKNVARDIRAACSDLKSKSVFVPTPFGEMEIGWIDTVLHFKSSVFEELKKKYPNSKYDEEFINKLRFHNLLETLPRVMQSDENLIARVTLSERIIPYIAKMRENYTKLGFDEVAGFTSFYTFKLFFILMQFRDGKTQTGEVFYNVEQFRHDFDLKDKYKQTRGMIVKVIEPALAEIEEKTKFEVRFTPCHGKEKVKGTQKITNFYFSFKEKSPNPAKIEGRDVNTIDLIDGLTDKEREIVANKNAYADQKGITDPLHRQNLINQGLEQHRQAEKQVQEQKEREKAIKQAEKDQERAELERTMAIYEKILADDTLIEQFIIANVQPKTLTGIARFYFENGNTKGLFTTFKQKFESVQAFRVLDLSMV